MSSYKKLAAAAPLLVSLLIIPSAFAAPRNDLIHRQYTSKVLEDRAAGSALAGGKSLQIRDTSAPPAAISEFTDGQPQATVPARSVQMPVTAQSTPLTALETVPEPNIPSAATAMTESFSSSAYSGAPNVSSYATSTNTGTSQTSVVPTTAPTDSVSSSSSAPVPQYGPETSSPEVGTAITPSSYGPTMYPGTRSSALPIPSASISPGYGSSSGPYVTGTNVVPKPQTSMAPTATDTCDEESATNMPHVSYGSKMIDAAAMMSALGQASAIPSAVDTAVLQSAFALESSAISQWIAEESAVVGLLSAAVQAGPVNSAPPPYVFTTPISVTTSSSAMMSASGGPSEYPSQSSAGNTQASSSTINASVSSEAVALSSAIATASVALVSNTLLTSQTSTAVATPVSTVAASLSVSGAGSGYGPMSSEDPSVTPTRSATSASST